VWWATLVFGGLVYVFMSFATVAAESRGVADPTLLWLSYAGASVGVRAIGPGLPDRLGPSRVLVPAMLSYVAAFALAAAADSLPAFLVAGFLGGLAHGYCFPILAGQTFTRSPPHLRGSAMAAFTALWDAASLLFVPLAGLLADLAGDRWMFGTVVICTLLALVGWARLERRHAPALTPRGPDVG
jgi:predicted MFS family arabinose efflux permease